MIALGLPDLLDRLASETDDVNDSGTYQSDSADGRVGRARAIRALDRAQTQEYMRLRGDRVEMTPFKQEITITVDSSDSERYPTTPRTREVMRVFDNNETTYRALPVYRTGGYGYVVEEGGRAIRLRNVNSPQTPMKAWVIQAPPAFAEAKNSGTSATTIVFPASPTLGTTDTSNDYYVGARVCNLSDGQIRTITDYVGSTRTATVATWDSTPTASTAYCIMFDLPEIMVESVVLRAALSIARVDRVLEKSLGDIRAAYDHAYRDARSALEKMNTAGVHGVRQSWNVDLHRGRYP